MEEHIKEFEEKVIALGIRPGAMTLMIKDGRVQYLNEYIDWLWYQFLKMKGVCQ